MASAELVIVNIGTLSMNKFWGEMERVRTPSATCTLLTAAGNRVLVDPSPHPEELERLLFARTGLKPEVIDLVYLTHWHGDHRFGLELFADSRWLMAEAALAEWQEAVPADQSLISRFHAAEGRLPEGIELFPTPGHTQAHTSLQVEGVLGPVVVAGDAVMTRDYLRAEEGFHNSVDFCQAKQTIARIKEVADVIVPGHDNYLLNRRGERGE